MFKLVQNKHQQNKLSLIIICSLSLSVQTTLTQIICIPNTYNRVSSPTQYEHLCGQNKHYGWTGSLTPDTNKPNLNKEKPNTKAHIPT